MKNWKQAWHCAFVATSVCWSYGWQTDLTSSVFLDRQWIEHWVGFETTTSTAPSEAPSESDEDLDSDSVCDPESENTETPELLTVSEAGLEESQELLLQPNQPRLKNFPSKQFGKNKIEYRSFNSKWFDNENWSTWLGQCKWKSVLLYNIMPKYLLAK